jgi:hypothetical protein
MSSICRSSPIGLRCGSSRKERLIRHKDRHGYSEDAYYRGWQRNEWSRGRGWNRCMGGGHLVSIQGEHTL